MNVWLVQTGEPLPPPVGASRLWRTGLLARELTRRGHDVRWLTSAWDHASRRKHPVVDREVVISGLGTLVFVPCLGYRSAFSPSRVVDHAYVAWMMSRMTRQLLRPAAILTSLPTIESSFAIALYARKNDIPFVVDIRDQWPDVISEMFGPHTQPMVRAATQYLNVMAKSTLKHATAITGNGEGAVDWGLRKASRKRGSLDRAFPMGYEAAAASSEELSAGFEFWRNFGIDHSRPGFIVVYTGVINRRTRDLDTVIAAAVLLQGMADITFVLCGVGEDYEALKSQASAIRNVVMPGWVDRGPLRALLAMANVGVNPSRPISNFEVGVTNKPIEYLAAGLPVLTTISSGELWDRMKEAGCAAGYRVGSSSELADFIRDLAFDKDGLRKKREAALELFRGHYDAERVYGDMASWFVRLAHDAGRKAG